MKNTIILISLISLISCKDNNKDLKQKKEQFENGKIKASYFVNSSGQKDSIETIYYVSGEKKIIKHWENGDLISDIIFLNKKGDTIGVSNNEDHLINMFDKDEIIYEYAIKNGTQNGLGIQMDKENKILTSKTYKNDFANGLGLLFRDSIVAIPKYIFTLKDDKRTGFIMKFNKKGALSSVTESNIFNNGQFINFNSNGTVKLICYKLKGSIDGWAYKFNENGLLVKKILYDKGSIVNEIDINGGG